METMNDEYAATVDEVVGSLSQDNAQLRLQVLTLQISNQKLMKRILDLERVTGLEVEDQTDEGAHSSDAGDDGSDSEAPSEG